MADLPIEFDPTKDISEVIDEIESYLKLPLEDKTPRDSGIDECYHLKVFLDAQNRSVQCQDCKKILDPFWYLQLLAKEWRLRRYHDAKALEVYRTLRLKEKQDESRGKHFARPKDGEGQKCWDAYELLYSKPPDYVRARGKYWYAGEGSGETLGDYIKQLLADKYNKMGLPAPDICN